ncbi:N-acetylmuramoyl-L-alanine amidase [Oenococcus alcoholitolerans]|uniref:N-acetylmuramoyl-L-alanine amidase n=1 Tax=Oenococcus alcoholitolerans TaxID=931074 RepID=UPI003F6F4A98
MGNNKIRKPFRINQLIAPILILIICLILLKMVLSSLGPVVRCRSINLHKNASPVSATVKTVDRGQRLKILKKDNDSEWWYVQNGKSRGWVASWLINKNAYDAKTMSRLAEATIVLDPGHGGIDSGTLSENGSMERSYTLPTALATADRLKSSFARTVMTRRSNKTVALARRPQISNRVKASIFISFHFNSAGSHNLAYGYEVFKYHKNADRFASILDKNFSDLNLFNRGIAFGNYQVLRDNKRPAVLIEMGFMDSDHDFPYIKSPRYHRQIAADINKSLIEYFR